MGRETCRHLARGLEVPSWNSSVAHYRGKLPEHVLPQPTWENRAQRTGQRTGQISRWRRLAVTGSIGVNSNSELVVFFSVYLVITQYIR